MTNQKKKPTDNMIQNLKRQLWIQQRVKTFTAIATIGLIRGYSKQSITLAELIGVITGKIHEALQY
jgi:hypothetical protein